MDLKETLEKNKEQLKKKISEAEENLKTIEMNLADAQKLPNMHKNLMAEYNKLKLKLEIVEGLL